MNAATVPTLSYARAVLATPTEDLYTLVDTQPIATVEIGCPPVNGFDLTPRAGAGTWEPPLTYEELERLLHRMRTKWNL